MPGTSTTTRRPRGRVVSSEWLIDTILGVLDPTATPAGRSGERRTPRTRLRGHQREHANGTPTAINDLERRREHEGAGRGQPLEVAQAREAEFPSAVHDRVVGEGRIEPSRLAGISADGFNTDAKHIAVGGQQLRRTRIEARTVWTVSAGVDERRRLGPAAPAGS